MKLSDIGAWTQKNPTVAIVLICAVATVLIVALWLGVDMTWFPGFVIGLFKS